jgi:hypothetical protein
MKCPSSKSIGMNNRWNKFLVAFLFLFFVLVRSFSSSEIEPTRIDVLEKESEAFLGKWEGFLKDKDGNQVQIVLEILKNEDKTWKCLFSMPHHGLQGASVQDLSIKERTISITIPLVMFTYSGSLKEDQQTIEGVLKRDKTEIKLNLVKVIKISSMIRPQTPQKPYPYEEKDLKFKNIKDNIILAGTLTHPKSGGPFPAAILISGAGPQDRNEEGFSGHRPFHVLADYLTKRGIAVLRYDDRGVGESTGSQEKATSADLAEDVKAAFLFLKEQSVIDPAKIGLIGHSEGGFLAQLVASEIKEIAYIVLMAGPALPTKDILLYQLKIAAGQAVFPRPLSVDIAQSFEQIYTVLEKEQNDEMAKEKVYSILKEIHMPPDVAKEIVEYCMSPWNRYQIKINPEEFLSKVKCPVLALGGNKDTHVPSTQNLKAVEEILQKAGNKNYKTVELSGLNHLFQTARTGLVTEYSLLEETMAPVVLRTIGDWIIEQVK